MIKPMLFVMCGVAGVGKSSFAAKYMKEGDIIVSRDAIRLSIISEDEDFFSHEDEVFKEFTRQVNMRLEEGRNVWADATHLTKASRKRFLSAIKNKDDYEIYCISLSKPLEKCLEQNERRRGTRAYVPRDVVTEMYKKFLRPTEEEGFYKVLYF